MESGEGEKRENCSTSRGKRLLRTLPAPAPDPARGTAVRRAMRAAFMAAEVAIGDARSVGDTPGTNGVLAAPPPVGAPSRAASIYTRGGRCSAGPAPPRRRNVPLQGARDGPPCSRCTSRPVRGGASPASRGSDGATGCPAPWRRAVPADLGGRAMSAPCGLAEARELRAARCPLGAARRATVAAEGLPSVPCLCPAWMCSLGLNAGLVTGSSCTADPGACRC